MPPLTDLNASESATTRPWYVLSQETVFSELDAGSTGLDTAEASQHMERNGPNRLPEAPPRSPLMRLLAQFHNLLIYVLLGAAFIAGGNGALGGHRHHPRCRCLSTKLSCPLIMLL